jgi:hypothetical protein
VGRKRNKIRCDPEEKDPMRSIIVEYRSETAKIPPYSTDDIFFRIGGEPEGPVSPAGDGVIDAGIPDLHRQISVGYVKKGARIGTMTGEYGDGTKRPSSRSGAVLF